MFLMSSYIANGQGGCLCGRCGCSWNSRTDLDSVSSLQAAVATAVTLCGHVPHKDVDEVEFRLMRPATPTELEEYSQTNPWLGGDIVGSIEAGIVIFDITPLVLKALYAERKRMKAEALEKQNSVTTEALRLKEQAERKLLAELTAKYKDYEAL